MFVFIASLFFDCAAGQFFQTSTSSCQNCPADSVSKADLTGCVCKDSNAAFNPATATCDCPDGSFNMAGQCIDCGSAGVKPDGSGCNCAIGFDIYQRRCCESPEIFTSGNCWVCPSGSTPAGSTCNCNVADTVYNPTNNVCECPNSAESLPQYYYNGACYTCPSTPESGATGGLTDTKENCACTVSTKTFSRQTGVCACTTGQYFYDGKCKTCPRESTSLNNVAPYCTCTLEHSSFDLTGNTCKCDAPYFFAATICKLCPSDSDVSADNLNCVCKGKDAFFDPGELKCTCAKTAFKTASNDCTTCPVGSKPDTAQTTCLCAANQVYVVENNTCVCDTYSIPSNGTCMRCPDDATKDANGLQCVCNDATNGVYITETNKCRCKDANMFKSMGTCIPCPSESLPSPELTECLCLDPQKHFDQNQCATCPDHSWWNAADGACTCIAPGTFLDGNCACPEGQGWFYGLCQPCPSGSSVVDGACMCGAGFAMTTSGCVSATADISQRSTAINMKVISLPGPSTNGRLCYYQEFVQAYTYLERDLDFSLCPSDASTAMFMEARRLQNNLLQATLYFAGGSNFQGVFALYQPAVEIAEMRFTISIFAPTLLNASLACPITNNFTIVRSNFTYIFNNATSNTFFGLVRTALILYVNQLDYEAEMVAPTNQPNVFLLSGPANTSTFLNDTRFTINMTSNGRFAAVSAMDGDATVLNVNFTGRTSILTGGLLFYDAGVGRSGTITITNSHFNATMLQSGTSASSATQGTIGFRTYLSNVALTNCIIQGIRASNTYQCVIIYTKSQGSNSLTATNLKLCSPSYNGSTKQHSSGSTQSTSTCQ